MTPVPPSALYTFDTHYLPYIPVALQTRPQWVLWQGTDRVDKRTRALIGLEKKPIDPHTFPPRFAASTNAASWSTLQHCLEVLPACLAFWCQHTPATYRGGGIGFVFSKSPQGECDKPPTDPYTGIDLDHCRDPDSGVIVPWAEQLVQWLNSYTEISPSGTGLKIFVQGMLPGSGSNKQAIEMYDRGRFFTVTGWHVASTPPTIASRQPHIEALYAVHALLDAGLQRYGERLSLIFAGRWEHVQNARQAQAYASQSEADLAFCALLHQVGATEAHLDTLMRCSGLMRPKWDTHHGAQTYGAMTIAKALRQSDGTSDPRSRPRETPYQQPVQRRGLAEDKSCWEPPIPLHSAALPAFPVHVLPEPLHSYVVAMAQATQTPTDLAGMLVLAVCAAALAKKVIVCVRPGYLEPVNLFVAVVMPPGTRKSTVFAAVTKPLQDFESAAAQRIAPLPATAASRRRMAERVLDQVEALAVKATSNEERHRFVAEAEQLAQELATLHVPVIPRLLTDDITPERLATLLSLHGGRMAVMSAEGGDLFDHMRGRYALQRLPHIGVYLKGHAGDALRVDRVQRPGEYVAQPALTVALTLQPEVLHGLMETSWLRGRGLLGRFLYAMPPNVLGHRRIATPPVPEAVRQAYAHTIMQLLAVPFGTNAQGEPEAHSLHLTPEAHAVLQDFEAWLEPQLAPFGTLGQMTDWAGKLVGTVARLCGILHMAAHGDAAAAWTLLISKEHVEHAICLGHYLIPHAQSAYDEMEADPITTDATYLLAWIRRASPQQFTKREAFEGTKGRFKRVTAMEPALQLLIEHDFIRPSLPQERSGPGRKPSPIYLVNPLGASQNAQNAQNAVPSPYSANSANSATGKVAHRNSCAALTAP